MSMLVRIGQSAMCTKYLHHTHSGGNVKGRARVRSPNCSLFGQPEFRDRSPGRRLFQQEEIERSGIFVAGPAGNKQNRRRVATSHFPYLGENGQAADSVSISVRSAGTAWRLQEVAQPDVAVAALEQPSAAPAAVAQPSAAEVAAEHSPAVAGAGVTARPSSAPAGGVRKRAAAVAAAHSPVVAVAVMASQSAARVLAACARPAGRSVAAWERTSPRMAA